MEEHFISRGNGRHDPNSNPPPGGQGNPQEAGGNHPQGANPPPVIANAAPIIIHPPFVNPADIPPPIVIPPIVDHMEPSMNGSHHDSLKKHKQIPIYIVEDHHQVVPFIHENIRKRYLPLQGNTLIHLDSHPDMLIPKDLLADEAFEPRVLYESHDIENWILPNCYTGIFHQIVWVKPPWAHQIRNKNQKIYIGKNTEGTLRLECKENYFIAEGLYQVRQNLVNVKEISFDCFTLGNRLVEAGDDIGEMRSFSENIDKTPVILDIDLDFFSTRNPFLPLYEHADLYFRLKSLFKFTPPRTNSHVHILEAQDRRIRQLQEIEQIFNHLGEFGRMPDPPVGAQPSPIYAEILSVLSGLAEWYPLDSINWDLVYNAGCTIDDNELPHHVSTAEELRIMFQSFENFIDTFLEPPRIITISRSSSDEYTPANQVEEIQAKVLEILNRKFPCAPPVLDYLDMEQAEEQPADDPMSISSEEPSTMSQLSDSSAKTDSGSGSSELAEARREGSASPASDQPGPSNR
ncbi:hypothetical protein HHI36_007068 [Cryptolaemus montrouzieri]|uniref:Uncharacterized protein n=1 Tax=Cryptolaemus montrouzieri TaxID=559131 RepID=A0ABD2MNK7_9CUCU